MRGAALAVLGLGFWLTGCSSTPTTKQLAQDALNAMGGREKLQAIKALSMKGGSGTRYRLGQTVRLTDQEMPAELKSVVEIVDLASGRASLDYEILLGDFRMHRHEVLTRRGDRSIGVEYVDMRPVIATSPGGLFSWGTQNSPEFLLRRNAVTVALAAADAVNNEQPAVDKELAGKTYKYGTARTKAGEEIGLYFDPESKLLGAFEVTDTESMIGDVPAQYILGDYKTVESVKLPYHITIRKGGRAYAEVQFSAMALNDPSAEQVFAVPEAAAKEADLAAAGEYTPLQIKKVADGVFFAHAYSHNSMVVEFPSFLAVVEAPYTETQSKLLARLLSEQFPGKPIRYAAVTHHHYDHTGGVRGIAAQGAITLVEKGHEAALREILEARHTSPPDDLNSRRAVQQGIGPIETFEGKKVLAEGKQTLELYAITGSPHVDPMVVGYVPSARALFNSDLFFPGTGLGGPLAEHLLASIRKLNLKVDTMIGGHGGVGPFDEIVKATTPKTN